MSGVVILDSAAAIRRALAQVGQPDGAGACLANVFKWFGSVQSVGPGAGHYDWAIKAWTYSAKRNGDLLSAPAGTAVIFDAVGAPRWDDDRNYPCGDIGLSLGGGRGVFTDGPNGNTAIMTFAARSAQIGRPMKGFIYDFLGHDTTAGLAALAPASTPAQSRPIVVRKKGDDGPMYAVRNATNGAIFALSPAQVTYLSNSKQAEDLAKVSSTADETHNLDDARLKKLFQAFDVTAEATDPKWLIKNANDGKATWSRAGVRHQELLAALK